MEGRNKMDKRIQIVGAIVIIFCGVFFISLGVGFHSTSIYSGEEIFNTQQEFVAFKQLIGSDDVNIRKLDILSPDLPIIVHFSVNAPENFPYGNKMFYLQIMDLVIGSILIGGGVCLARDAVETYSE